MNEPRDGDRVGTYRIERLLGRGGMGVVWLAVDERLGRPVALKLLDPGLALDHGFRARFLAESRAAASLDHPNIVPIYEAGEAAGVLYIAMRYVEGSDLASLLEADGPLDPPRTIGLLRGIADALDAAHARGLIHRDVKPGNILVAATPSGGHAYLTDFGLTKLAAAGSSLTEPGTVIGSVGYMAPEQIRGGPIDGRADVYSLACVAFEALCGMPPYDRSSDIATLVAHVQASIPNVSSSRPDLAGLDRVLAVGLAKDPAGRFGTADAFLVALADAAADADAHRGRTMPHPTGDQTDPFAKSSALAAALTPLIGRERDLAAIESKLDAGVRLLTVSGPGIGKTRLALEVFARARAHGLAATFVDLVGLGDAGLVPAEVAMAWGVSETTDEDAAAAVASSLAGKATLLVLDNLEELVRARTFLARLLTDVPGLQMLVTSRIPLGLRGETEFPLAPLDLPAAATLAGLEASPAGALFLARARALGRLAEVDEPTAHAIADLCRRLDGLPLAIELAAARTRILPPASILRNLESHRAGLLTKVGEVDPRHGSLDTVIDWSLDLLEPNEADVLGAVAICPGGFDLAIAEALAPGRDVLRAIDVLATHGLLIGRVEVDGEAWYHLLETIRAAALDRVPTDLTEKGWRRLAMHVAERVEATLEAYYQMDLPFFRCLDLLLDDVRAVFDRMEESDSALRLEIAARFYPYWRLRSQSREGRERLHAAISGRSADSADLARAWLGVAQMERQTGGLHDIRSAASEAARIARAVDLPEVEIGALAILLETANVRDAATVDRIRALLPLTGHPVARYFGRMGLISYDDGEIDGETRIRLCREAGAELAGSPYRLIQGMAEANLASTCLTGGVPDEAFDHATRALMTMIDASPDLLVWLLATRAAAASASGRTADARTSLRSALDVASGHGTRLLVDVLPTTIVVLARSGAPLLAARAWGAMSTEAIAEATTDVDIDEVTRLMGPIREADTIAFDGAFEAGREAGAQQVMVDVTAYLDGGGTNADA